MKRIVGLLGYEYTEWAEKACCEARREGHQIVYHKMGWTGNVGLDCAVMHELNIEILVVQGHYTHYGFRLARVAPYIGVEPIIVSTAEEIFPPHLPITQIKTFGKTGTREGMIAELKEYIMNNTPLMRVDITSLPAELVPEYQLILASIEARRAGFCKSAEMHNFYMKKGN